MTAGSNHYVEYLLELLTPLGNPTSKSFFGGVALVFGATQFAMVMGNELYFVVDDSSRPSYERMGSSCFSYATKKRRVEVRKYYTVPAEVIEDQDRLVALARESIRVASSLKKQGRTKTIKFEKAKAVKKKRSRAIAAPL
jgi:DNA transformation protein